MKIAMLGHKRMPSREGGVEVVIEELATRMAALGHDVTLYSRKGHNVAGSEFDDPTFDHDEYEYKGVRVKQVRTIDVKGLAAVTSSIAAMKAAIADKPDVIHVHAEGPCATIGMAKRAGIRTIATIHGLDWQRAKWGRLGRTYIKYGEKVAAKKADEIIVLSENVKQYFNTEYGRDTVFISNGVEAKTCIPARLITEKYGLAEGSYILFLGRMVPEKGIHYLIEAFKRVDTDKKLIIAGGSSDTDNYYAELKKKAAGDDRIVFIGFVQGKLLEELYSNCALYVLPSDLEGMPMSLLEAMAHGVCCLTSDIFECVEVIGGCGITFKRGNSLDLADKIDVLLKSPDLSRKLGVKAEIRVLKEYCWDSVVDTTLRIYSAGGE